MLLLPGGIPGDRPHDPEPRRVRDPGRPCDQRLVHEAARAEAKGQPGRLADPDPERAALDDPQLRLPRVGRERERDGRRRDRIGRLDDRLVHAVDEPADALGAVPVDLLDAGFERPRERRRHPLAVLQDPQPHLRRRGEREAERDLVGAAVAVRREREPRDGDAAERAGHRQLRRRGRDAAAGCVRGELDPEDPVRQRCRIEAEHVLAGPLPGLRERGDLGAEHVQDPHGHVRGRVQRVRDRRAVGDRVAVRRDRLRVDGEPGDRERDVAAADHALRRRHALRPSGSCTCSSRAAPSVASHVQSTLVPLPGEDATAFPAAS